MCDELIVAKHLFKKMGLVTTESGRSHAVGVKFDGAIALTSKAEEVFVSSTVLSSMETIDE